MTEKQRELLARADAWIEAHKEEFITELQGMTRIPSISRADLAEPGAPFGPECRKMLDYALERGRYYGFETMDHEGYAGSICLGDPDNAIGLFAHLDVVPEGEGWIYPPYEAVYLPEHDAVVGRGSDDNKCAAVAVLFVMRMLKEFGYPLKHGIRLFCGTSEETGMQDMIALKEKGFAFPKISLVPDAGFPVNYGQKGFIDADLSIPCEGNLLSFAAGNARNTIPNQAEATINVPEEFVQQVLAELDVDWTKDITVESCGETTKLIAAGKSAHAASPESGINAIYLLTRVLTEANLLEGSCKKAIATLYQLTSGYYGENEGVAFEDEMSGKLTLIYGVAHLKEGVLEIKPDSRTPVTCDADKLIADMSKAWEDMGFTVTETSVSKPYYVSTENPYVVALQELFHDVTGREDEPFVMSGGNYARVIPNAYSFGPGMPTKKSLRDFLPEGHGDCHSPDEAVIMEKVYNCARIYTLAVTMFDEMAD